MAEFVENRFYFAVCEQRRPIGYRGSQISAHQPQMRFTSLRISGNERIHPRATALVLTGEPIRVEAAQKFTRSEVFDAIVFDGRVPARNALLVDELNAENTAEDVEHPGHYSVELKIGPQLFFIELVKRLPLLLGKVSDVPGLNVGGSE